MKSVSSCLKCALMSLCSSVSFLFIYAETLMYFLLGYLLKYEYVLCVRFMCVCSVIHLSPHVPTQSHKGAAIRKRKQQNWRGSCIFANVRMTLELRGTNTKTRVHPYAWLVHKPHKQPVSELRCANVLFMWQKHSAHADSCTGWTIHNITYNDTHKKKSMLTAAYACLHMALASNDTNTHTSGVAQCFSRFLSASFSLTASGRLLFRLFKLSFWDFSFPNNKNLALKLNKDQRGKLPRKTSATHFPLEYMIRKFIYV